MKKLNNRPVKSLLAGLLAFVLVFVANITPAFAILPADILRQVKEQGVEDSGSPEWLAFEKAWSNYFLDLMPTEDEPELLELLKIVPAENDVAGWHEFFGSGGGDPDVMYQELQRVAKKLDLRNPSLSLHEKNDMLHEWLEWGGEYIYGPFGWGSGGRTVDGYEYDCKTVALGDMALFRVAGIPATNVLLYFGPSLHTEAVYFLDGKWRLTNRSSDWTDYFELYSPLQGPVDVAFSPNDAYRGKEAMATGWPRSIDDINELWIDIPMETVMGALLQQPMAYPERTLTRGEVAKLVCNYFGMVPMRSEPPFSDVPSTHKYARYIWGVNRAGIMSGDGAGTFRPDDTLSMQEFAVIASRMVEYGKKRIVADIEATRIKFDQPEVTAETMKWVEVDIEQKEADLARLNPPADRPAKIFADADKIAAWAKPAVDELSRFGVLEGDESSHLNPTAMLDKTRFLVFIAKFEYRLRLLSGKGSLSPYYPLF
jgi:hypothetical protein